MTRMRLMVFVLVLLVIAAPWSSALAAEPVLYTIKLVASGTVGSGPFTDEPLVFAGVTDTDTLRALAEVDPEVDPAIIQRILSALSVAAGVILLVVAIFELKQHAKIHGQGQDKLLATLGVILASSQIVPIVRDGALVNLTIDSIRDNIIELQLRHVAGGL